LRKPLGLICKMFPRKGRSQDPGGRCLLGMGWPQIQRSKTNKNGNGEQ
jgi:hypothetical protein